VEIALKAGYRHVDTATGYANEKEVGEGIKASGVPRNEVFLTPKLSPYDMNPSNVKSAMEYSLKQLDTYIDLCEFLKLSF
jgi:glycerol 2-dehydrogenase (NADP+)